MKTKHRYNANASLRDNFRNSISALGSEACSDLSMRWDLLCKSFSEDEVLDLFYEAFLRLDNQIKTSTASASYTPLLSPRGKTISDELTEFSKTHKAKSSKEILSEKVRRFNEAISNAQVTVNGKLIEPEVFDCMKITIPSALRAKERLQESYAAAKSKRTITSLDIEIRIR